MGGAHNLPLLPTIFDPVGWWAQVDGERVAAIDAVRDVRVSYRALHHDADRWLALLAERGVKPGDRVAILAQNRYEFLPLFFACIRLGAMLVPLNWRLSSRELALVLAHATPALVFGEHALRPLAVAAVAAASPSGDVSCSFIDLDHDAPALLSMPHEQQLPAPTSRSYRDTTMLLYTSGSTGVPKGVMVPHRQLLWNAMATTTGWALGPDDVAPATTPFFHTSGWHVFVTPLLYRGGTVVIMGAFEPEAYLDAFARYAVTMVFGVPTQLDALQQAASWGRSLPALRTFISGGAPCPQRTRDAVRAAGYRLRECYGLTECGPNCFATTHRVACDKDGSVGWPIPFLDMRVTSELDGLVPDGDVGELQLRGPQLFGGYYRDAERTEQALTADGWLRTGDLVQRDADGVYRICGRRTDMYISGGENIFPGEVEAALLECEAVSRVAVVGVPDDKWGEVGCAVVVSAVPEPDAATLLADVRRGLAAYKVPRHVLFTEQLPTLGTGKIDRKAVLAWALARLAPVAT